MNRFGTWLARERQQRKWSLEVLGGRIRANKSLVSRWESGDSVPSVPHFARLCRVLGADANRVLRLVLKDAAA